MMKLGLTPREQRLLLSGGLLALVVLWTYTTYIVQPLMREGAQLREDVVTAQDRLKLLEVTTAQEGALRGQYQQLNETVAALQRLLPDEKRLSEVIERLSDLASQSDVKIQTIFPQKSDAESNAEKAAALQKASTSSRPAGPIVYRDVVIQIDATAGFHQVGTFLGLMEAQSTPLQLTLLRVSSDPKVLKRQRVKMLIRAYFSPTAGDNPLRKAPAATQGVRP